jgi:ankyrin repeat protein
VNIVEFLVERDPSIAKILLVDAEGTTPLHNAAKNNSYAIAEILINSVSF